MMTFEGSSVSKRVPIDSSNIKVLKGSKPLGSARFASEPDVFPGRAWMRTSQNWRRQEMKRCHGCLFTECASTSVSHSMSGQEPCVQRTKCILIVE